MFILSQKNSTLIMNTQKNYNIDNTKMVLIDTSWNLS